LTITCKLCPEYEEFQLWQDVTLAHLMKWADDHEQVCCE
jgi:hypothetical protein